MKKLFTLFTFCFLTVFGLQAQSQKVVLIEHFTQASCGPCATINPQIRPLIEANADKVAIIHHQTSWPGFDPMHNHNPGDVNRRVDYYGVRSVPGTVINGEGPEYPTGVVTQANINAQYAQKAKMELDLQVDANSGFSGLEIELNMTANEALSGPLAAFVVVIEEEIVFNSSPGSNGERVFHNVLKKILPNSSGTDLPATWTSGMSETISMSYTFENFYDWKDAGVVAFVQNTATKEILQAHHWSAEFEPTSGDDVLIQAANAAGRFGEDFVCGVSTEPIITVMNGGETPLSSFDVEYSINGGATSTYTWNGSAVSTFETVDVTLPSIGFSRDLVNELEVEVMQPNGQEDQEPTNGSSLTDFLPSEVTTIESEFTIRGRIRPEVVSFTITDDAGNVILEESELPDRNVQSYPLNLDANTCYTVEVNNTYSSLNGDFELLNKEGERIFKVNILGPGPYFKDFGTFFPVSNDDLNAVADWSISPNPGVEDFVITANVVDQIDATIEVVDLIGSVHKSINTTWAAGEHTQYVNLSNLPNGMYLVSIKNGDKVSTKRWIKQ